MRTRLILAEGANHAQINPPSTHSRCVHLECDEVEVGPRATSGSAAPACQQTKVTMCTKVRNGDAHDFRKQPADGVHHAEEKSPSPLTVKPLWQ
jgi:hypothetical protein